MDAGGHTDPTQDQPTANRLYLDVDLNQGIGPDTIVCLTVDEDDDGDGVPDAVDNAYLTDNSLQRDTDDDAWANIADGDFDNNNLVSGNDFTYFKSKWNTADPDADMDGNGLVSGNDFILLKARWNDSPSYY